jgi:type 1 glutamine amidotransferase
MLAVPLIALADDAPRKGARLLFVSQSVGFRHGSVTRPEKPAAERNLAPAERAIDELGIKSNLFRADFTQDVAKDLTRERLDAYDILLFYTTGDLPIAPEVRDYLFTDWVKQKGHGFIGTHSAADTFHNYQPYWEMLGGTFDGHPWNADQTVTVTVHDTSHPVAKPWGDEFTITDEIYKFKNWQPEKVRVLMSLNMAKTKLKQPYHVPIAWCKEYGQGRVVHMSLGHREDVWTNPKYVASLQGAVEWILGRQPGEAAPNPELSKAQEAKAKADYEAAQK